MFVSALISTIKQYTIKQ